MSRSVKLVSLAVQDVGALTGRVELGPFSSGVTVVSGRNEAGKSTLVAALRAALFERHDARNANVKALQTHGTSNAPEVWVELDIGGERVSVHKRFLVKPVVEVRWPGGGAPEQGAFAEETLLRRLEGRAPNQRGAKRSDMGLWGLLWVTQDEIAHQDPGEDLDEGMRGDLWDTVGRQVGQMMGGKHGERVRTAVIEQRARYLTPTTEKPTGEYKAAIDRLEAAQKRVREIQQAIDKVEELARQREALGEQLREKGRQLPRLQREHAAAVAAAEDVTRLATKAREARGRFDAAEASLAAAGRSAEDRVTLAAEVARLAEEIQKSDEVVAELDQTLAPRGDEARAAREAAATARGEAARAREALDAEARRLSRARRREEATRASKQLEAAEEVAQGLAEAVARYAAEALDEATLEQLSGLSSRSATLRARLDGEGTRIVCHPAGSAPIVRSVGARATIEVPGLGVLEVEPARPGLAQAAVDAGKLGAQLAEALLGLGAGDVQVARDRAAARAVIEDELAELAGKKIELAPRGLEAVEQKLRTIEADRARLEAALTDVALAEQALAAATGALAENPFGEDSLDVLRRKERDVAIQRAACDAMGTQVEIVALADLRLRGAGRTGERLAAGGRLPLAVTQATTVVIEDVAELRFEPRGKDLAKSRGKLLQAEQDLAASLAMLGVAGMVEAVDAARASRELEAARGGAEQRLAELAPQGVAKLRAEAEKVRKASRATHESLAEAKRAFARHAQLEVELAQNPATREALSRLEKIERKLRESEAEIERFAARVRAISGPVAAGPARAWTVASAVKPPAVDGLVWEILPGELGGELDVEGEERRLREALERAGVADVEAARKRLHVGLTLGARIAELRKQLGSLAPDGLDALRARAGALGSGSDPGDTGDERVGVGQLETSVKELDERLRGAHTTAEDAAGAAERAERVRAELEISVRECRAARAEKAAQHAVVVAKLDGARGVEVDADLSKRATSARSARDRARELAEAATAELEAATPELLQDEVHRAQGAIQSWRLSHGKLSDDALRLDTLLGVAAAEGRFEELGEAEAEHLEATDALARIERERRAAGLLSRVVEDAYAESQRIFLAPVLKEAAPYLTKLRPGTEIRMTRDLKLDKVVRRGAEEDFGQLSGGTREQLSVIVRLSLARVLARDKRSLPLILDDTMGWTDDARFLSMVQILRDASRDLQVILLTCHPWRFERFQADCWFDLDKLKEPRSPELP